MELKVVGVRSGVLCRSFDTAVKVLVEDACVVDCIQSLGPQYELTLCSSGRRLVSVSPDDEDDVKSPGNATPTNVLRLGELSVDDVFLLQVCLLLLPLLSLSLSLSLSLPTILYRHVHKM